MSFTKPILYRSRQSKGHMYIITRRVNGEVYYITDYGSSTDRAKAAEFDNEEEAEDFASRIAAFVTLNIVRVEAPKGWTEV